MAVLGSGVATLVDVAKQLDPDGKIARVAERLTQSLPVLDDILWKEGNLTTGERTTVRVGLPAVQFRSVNQGVARSKSQVGQFDEGAAQLAAFSQVDRTAAELSGNPAQFRLNEADAFFEAMNQELVSTLFYGNANASPKEFTGFAPRFDDIGDQVLDAGGTGTDNHSIWLIVWGENTVRGIYPKGTQGGLKHQDMTAGMPDGKTLYDADGNAYVGYEDYFEWNCGLSIKDPRFVARAANVDISLLTKDVSTGADLQDILIQLTEMVEATDRPGTRAAFYMPKRLRTFLRRQLVNNKNAFLSWDEMAGRKIMSFDGIPVRRVDSLNTQEARVV